jgi:hypothetical protein
MKPVAHFPLQKYAPAGINQAAYKNLDASGLSDREGGAVPARFEGQCPLTQWHQTITRHGHIDPRQ